LADPLFHSHHKIEIYLAADSFDADAPCPAELAQGRPKKSNSHPEFRKNEHVQACVERNRMAVSLQPRA
jgi:hypothetical protein